MTFPAEAGVNVPAILFPVSSSGLAGKANLTQDVAEAALKEQYVKDNPGINTPLQQVFGGLGGLPGMLKGVLSNLGGDMSGVGDTLEEIVAAAVAIPNGIAYIALALLGAVGLPVGAINNQPANMWPDATFPADSINPNPFWSVGPTSRTDDGTGSAVVTADGTSKALRSGKNPKDVKPVTAGQETTQSIRISHTGYVGSGTGPAMVLQVVPFTGTTEGAPVTVTNVAPAPDGQTETVVPATYSPTGPDMEWPGYLLSGKYTPPDGVTGIQLRVLLTQNALAGTFRCDDVDGEQTGKLRIEWIDGLPEALQDAVGRFQLIIDTVLSALTKLPVVGGTLPQLFQMLGIIPGDSVQGAAGPLTMFDTAFAIIDAFLSGAVGVPGSTGGSLADVTNVAGELGSKSAQGAFAWQIVNMLNNTPVARGMLPTGRANYDITSANTFLATTQAAALSPSFGLLQAMPLGVFSWYGYGTSGITAFYINIRKVNPATGVRDLVHHSANIVGNLQPGTTPADADWMFYELPAALAGEATDNYFAELVPVGGTHYVRGMSFSDNIKDHPYAATPCVGTVANYSSNPNSPAASLPKATAGPNVPWIEFAVSIGGAADHHEPQIRTLADDGESIPIPSWCNRVDAIPLSKGGDGHAGLTAGFAGEPGQPGKFAPVTWERGTDFTGSATLITFNVLPDGSAKLSIPGHDTTAAPGENGASTKFGLTPVGKGPGVLSYNGQNYTAGVDQKVAGGPGANPGGAGNGGNGLFFQAGGPGGKPAGWVCFRQVEVPGESTGGDTTPPTPPTLTFDASTLSTLTVTASGATDS